MATEVHEDQEKVSPSLDFDRAWERFAAAPLPSGIDAAEFEILLEQEKEPCRLFFTALEQKRNELALKKPGASKVRDYAKRMARMMSVMWHHRNDKRKEKRPDGTSPPYSIHLWETAMILIDNGFVEQDFLEEALAHDAVEDIKEVASREVPLLFDFQLEDQKKLGRREEEMREAIDVVSKPPIDKPKTPEKKDLQSRLYMEKFLDGGQKIGRSILIKLADRVSNSRTFSAHEDESKRKELAHETLEVFCPLARRLGLIKIWEELTRNSLEQLNPQLIEDFDALMSQRRENVAHDDMWKQVESLLTPVVSSYEAAKGELMVSLIQNRKRRIAEVLTDDPMVQQFINRFSLESHPFVDYFSKIHGTEPQNVTLADLDVPETDTIMDVVVEVDSSRSTGLVLAHILKRMPGKEWKVKWNEDGSVMAKTYDQLYSPLGGKIVFKILSKRQRQWNERGCFTQLNELEIPRDVREEMATVVGIARSEARDVREVAREGLFYPFITADVYIDGHLYSDVKIKRGATVSDAIQQMELLVGGGTKLTAPRTVKDILPRNWLSLAQPLSLEAPVPDKHVLVLSKVSESV